jgi:hypothetical protein
MALLIMLARVYRAFARFFFATSETTPLMIPAIKYPRM